MVLSIWAMPGPSSGCFVMNISVRQHKVVNGGKLQKSESSLIRVVIAEGSTNALPVSTNILDHFAFQSSCMTRMSFSVSDQLHSVAGHRILLFRCHHSLTLGHTLVLLWCWKGLPSGGWWWACWRLGDIPRQCSRCPCEQEIQRHARVYPLLH